MPPPATSGLRPPVPSAPQRCTGRAIGNIPVSPAVTSITPAPNSGGVNVLCQNHGGGVRLTGQTLTAWLTQPVVGDSLLIFDNGGGADVNARWRAYAITGIATGAGVTGCPSGAGNFLQPGDTTASSYQVTVSPALDSSTTVGAPVRIYRRVHYELYQASDGNWYLGNYDCLSTYPGSQCGALTPVSGPYLAYSATPGASGLTLTYYDSTGAVLVPGSAQARRIARIDVTFRGQTQAPSALSGSSTTGYYTDSSRSTLALRNRN